MSTYVCGKEGEMRKGLREGGGEGHTCAKRWRSSIFLSCIPQRPGKGREGGREGGRKEGKNED